MSQKDQPYKPAAKRIYKAGQFAGVAAAPQVKAETGTHAPAQAGRPMPSPYAWPTAAKPAKQGAPEAQDLLEMLETKAPAGKEDPAWAPAIEPVAAETAVPEPAATGAPAAEPPVADHLIVEMPATEPSAPADTMDLPLLGGEPVPEPPEPGRRKTDARGMRPQTPTPAPAGPQPAQVQSTQAQAGVPKAPVQRYTPPGVAQRQRAQGKTPAQVPQRGSPLAAVAVVLGIIALATGVFIFPAVLLGVPAVILAVIAQKKTKKPALSIIAYALVGLAVVVASVTLVSSMGGLSSLVAPSAQSALEEMKVSGASTEDSASVSSVSQQPEALSGHEWSVSEDGSALVLNTDGTFQWYLYPAQRYDNYYNGTYEVYRGPEAFSRLKTFGIDAERAAYNGYEPEDVHYLKLTCTEWPPEVEATVPEGTASTTMEFYVVFRGGDLDEAGAMDLETDAIYTLTLAP